MTENERWKEVRGYDGRYMVSDQGRIMNASTQRILKGSVNERGYRKVLLSDKGKRNNHRVCRLVASAFVPNPEGYPYVDHINGDRTDDRARNLRWVTACLNAANPVTAGRNSVSRPGSGRTRPVEAEDGAGKVTRYASGAEGARAAGVVKWCVYQALRGRQRTAGGLTWRYA